jgi:hypothetical protein
VATQLFSLWMSLVLTWPPETCKGLWIFNFFVLHNNYNEIGWVLSSKFGMKRMQRWKLNHAMKAYWGSGGMASRILNLGSGWRWVVSFTHRSLYPQGKSPWYPLDRRLGGPQSQSGWYLNIREIGELHSG